MQNDHLIPDEELNILIYGTPSYIISDKLQEMVLVFGPPLYRWLGS